MAVRRERCTGTRTPLVRVDAIIYYEHSSCTCFHVTSSVEDKGHRIHCCEKNMGWERDEDGPALWTQFCFMSTAPHFSYLHRSRHLYNEGESLLFKLGSGVPDELRFEPSAFGSTCFACITNSKLMDEYTQFTRISDVPIIRWIEKSTLI